MQRGTPGPSLRAGHRTAATARWFLPILATLLACGPAEWPELVEVPTPDLSTATEGVRRQLGGQRQELDTLLAGERRDREAAVESLLDLGLSYLVYDLLVAAEACFVNAERLSPDDHRTAYLLGYLLQLQGRLEDAVPHLERSIALSAYPPAMMRLARAHLELGDPATARDLFERARQAEPAAAAAYEGLGKVAETTGEPREAIRLYTRALELQPKADSLHYSVGQAYRRLGDLERARLHLDRSGDVPVRIDDPLINSLASFAASPQFYLVQGGEAMEDEDYGTASEAYRQAIELGARDFRSYLALSFSLERLGDAAGAIDSLERGIAEATSGSADKDRTERANLHRYLANLLVQQGRESDAIAHYRRSLELEPEQETAWLKLADALSRQGIWQEALEAYDQLLEAAPSHAVTILPRRAQALINLGRGEEALADLERAVEAAPEDPRIRQQFAAALDHLGQPARAARQRRLAQRHAEPGADRARLIAAEGRRRQAAGELDAALEDYRRALELAPGLAAVRFELASILGHLGHLEEAQREFSRVVEAEPQHAGARKGEITALLFLGRYGEARLRINEALRLLPRDIDLARTSVRLLAASPDPRVRDGALALEQARRIYRARPDPASAEILALAYAAAGRFDEAEETQRQLIAQVQRSGDLGRLEELRQRLLLFQRREAWRASSPQEILGPQATGT